MNPVRINGDGLWNRATTPNVGILKQLIGKLHAEVEAITEHILFNEDFTLTREVERFEADLIRHVLGVTNWRQNEAARILGIKPTTLHYKIRRYGILRTAGGGE